MLCPVEKVTLYGWSMVCLIEKVTPWVFHAVPCREGYSIWVVHGVPIEIVTLYGCSIWCAYREGALWVVHMVCLIEKVLYMGGPPLFNRVGPRTHSVIGSDDISHIPLAFVLVPCLTRVKFSLLYLSDTLSNVYVTVCAVTL